MSDLFREQVPFDFVDEVFDRILEHDRHVYQVLTKRPEEEGRVLQHGMDTCFSERVGGRQRREPEIARAANPLADGPEGFPHGSFRSNRS